MSEEALADTAHRLIADHKGVLAMDESNGTCNRRFGDLGIPQTEEMRRRYRELIITTPGLGTCISGAILYDETIRQRAVDGQLFTKVLGEAEILTGIKVDIGATDLARHPGETVTGGLDGLRGRLRDYAQMGASFAKWRAVFSMGDELPSQGCIDANAQALARYAALSQEAGLVPVVEPEILMAGEHAAVICRQATDRVLREVFDQLHGQRVVLEGMLLKPGMVLAGMDCPTQLTAEEVADETIDCLLQVVPAAVPGIMFLSGGQSGELASARLNAMNIHRKREATRLPWALSFSYGRALQRPAMDIWRGEAAYVDAAQHALLHRAHCNRAARRGDYRAAMEAV